MKSGLEREQGPVSIETEKQLDHAVIRQVQADDIEAVLAITREWVKSPTGDAIENEIAEIRNALEQSLEESPDRLYIIAELDGEVAGVMGLAMPGDLMRQYAQTNNPIEIVNAFVGSDVRGTGIGGRLLDSIFEQARSGGFNEVVVNSGPRYKDTAWDFYDKKFSGRLATLKDYYGAGKDAPIWSKLLEENAQGE